MDSSVTAAKAARIAICVALVLGVTRSHGAENEAAASVRALNADLLAHDSATEVLGRWCSSHHLADPPIVRALRDEAVDKPADRRIRMLLHVRPGEIVRYRRVRLACGSHVMSNADNWYVPGRLTTAMNRRLERSDVPFGLVVKPLGYHRVRLAATVLPRRDRPSGAEQGVLRHEALLISASGMPFSLVIETYTPEVLAFSPSDR